MKMGRIFDVRRGEGRVALRGFAALLLLVITGHTVLEAARDALLLAGPGPRALGLVYIIIAVCTWPAAAVVARVSERFGARRALGATIAMAAVLPVSLFLVPPSHASAMAIYVASGLIGSLVVPQFWTLVGKVLTAAQGRRLFGLIAAAGVLGGVLGSGLAATVLLVLPVRALLLVSATVFLIAGTVLLRVGAQERGERGEARGTVSAGEWARTFRQQPVLSRIAVIVALSTATVLVLDYCFKSSVARSLPGPQIGPFVARYYLAVNVLSLVVQVFLSSAIVRRLGVTAAIVLTPLMLMLGAAGVVVTGGVFAAVLVMRAIDGSLRFSIHRITGELVYLPVPFRLRQHFKPLIDGALARASQTATGAVLLVLGGTWVLAPGPLAVGVTLLAAAWFVTAVSLRHAVPGPAAVGHFVGDAARGGQPRAPGPRERAAAGAAPRQRGAPRGRCRDERVDPARARGVRAGPGAAAPGRASPHPSARGFRSLDPDRLDAAGAKDARRRARGRAHGRGAGAREARQPGPRAHRRRRRVARARLRHDRPGASRRSRGPARARSHRRAPAREGRSRGGGTARDARGHRGCAPHASARASAPGVERGRAVARVHRAARACGRASARPAAGARPGGAAFGARGARSRPLRARVLRRDGDGGGLVGSAGHDPTAQLPAPRPQDARAFRHPDCRRTG